MDSRTTSKATSDGIALRHSTVNKRSLTSSFGVENGPGKETVNSRRRRMTHRACVGMMAVRRTTAESGKEDKLGGLMAADDH